METQKKLKKLKKDIANKTAINIGYYQSILQNIPNYAILVATRNICKMGLKDKTTDSELENMIVTESINAMNFQDFKKVAKYFFLN